MLQKTEDNGSHDHVRRTPRAIQPSSKETQMVDCTMSKCHSAMFEGDSSIRNNVLHANDQFQQKYFHNHIPFWSNKYASRTLSFCYATIIRFFSCWLFGCSVDLRSFVSVVMFFFSADVVFVTLFSKWKYLSTFWIGFFRWPNLCLHIYAFQFKAICPLLIYARSYAHINKYIERNI